METNDEQTAPEGSECPSCGENNIDQLVWDEDEHLACQSCGTVYDPHTNPVEIIIVGSRKERGTNDKQ